jgi:Fe2+ transport system protein FeoA
MPNQVSKPLTDIEEEGRFIVDSVSDQDALLLKRLNADGITPGARLQVTSASTDEFVLRTARASKALRLPRDLAGAIRIRSTDGRRS